MISHGNNRCLLYSILYIRDIKLLTQIHMHIAYRYMHESLGEFKNADVIPFWFIFSGVGPVIGIKKKIPGDSDVKPGLRPPLIDGEPEISTQLSGSQATQF